MRRIEAALAPLFQRYLFPPPDKEQTVSVRPDDHSARGRAEGASEGSGVAPIVRLGRSRGRREFFPSYARPQQAQYVHRHRHCPERRRDSVYQDINSEAVIQVGNHGRHKAGGAAPVAQVGVAFNVGHGQPVTVPRSAPHLGVDDSPGHQAETLCGHDSARRAFAFIHQHPEVDAHIVGGGRLATVAHAVFGP